MKSKTTLIGLVVFLIVTFTLPLDTLGQGKGKPKGPPPWAPAHGYRAKTKQVYFPEHNFYFDVQKNVYIYFSGDKWQVSAKLPSLYAGFDLKVAVKVELELDTDSPQKYNAEHKVKYKEKAKGNKGKGKKK